MIYITKIKPFLDFILALIILVFFTPVFVAIIILLMLTNKGSVFFYQMRVGKKLKVFKILKFKTMTDEKNMRGELLSDKQRITIIGNILRKTSLDELPQLLNVLRGDMSLVGPRPLLTNYISLYNDFQNRRHEVKPGITGWVQVNGRNAISWEQKFELDVWYVDNQTFWLDIKILFLTVQKIFKTSEITADGHVTMPPFTGSQSNIN